MDKLQHITAKDSISCSFLCASNPLLFKELLIILSISLSSCHLQKPTWRRTKKTRSSSPFPSLRFAFPRTKKRSRSSHQNWGSTSASSLEACPRDDECFLTMFSNSPLHQPKFEWISTAWNILATAYNISAATVCTAASDSEDPIFTQMFQTTTLQQHNYTASHDTLVHKMIQLPADILTSLFMQEITR